MINVDRLNNIVDKYYWYSPIIKNKDSTLKILVIAKESKQAYGRVDVLIQPVFGKGYCWVNVKNLEFEPYPPIQQMQMENKINV